MGVVMYEEGRREEESKRGGIKIRKRGHSMRYR